MAPTPSRITIADLTTGSVGGEGVFDKLMVSLVAHLKVEYEASRISGAEYTKAYTAIVAAALAASQQFILGAEQTYWSALTAEAQVTGLEYTNEELLPAQLSLLLEQVEVQRAQTLDTRTDTTPVTGSIGKQKDLYSQQIDSYQRDAETKVGKIFSDAWITQKTIDEGLLAPTQFSNSNVDAVLNKLRVANDLD